MAPRKTKPTPKKNIDDLVSEIEKRKTKATPDVGAKADTKAAAAKVPDAAEKKKMLKAMADHFGTSPEDIEKALSVSDVKALALVNPNAKPDAPHQVDPFDPKKDPTVPVRLKNDYWMHDHSIDQWPTPQDNRARAGTLVHLPVSEARKLIDAGKAERSDPLPGEVR